MNRYLYVAMAFLGIAYAVLWYNRQPDAPPGISLPATPAPEVAKVELEPLVVDFPLRVYKPEAKKRLKLPEHVQADAARHVVASTRTAPDERPHTVTTVLDSGTGKFETYDRADPLPWIGVATKSEVGVFYGIKGGEQALRIEGRHELLQVKALHVGVLASADIVPGNVDGFVGAGVWARW
jgi:hypothetical protein